MRVSKSFARGGESQACALAAVLALVGIAITLGRWVGQVPGSSWIEAAFHPASGNVAQLVFHFSSLPRSSVAAMSGAALAVSGAIFQHVLRNPLASPVTLGVSSGAQLALVAATVLAPTTLGATPEITALAGGVASMALVFAIASAQGLSSPALILSGLSVGLLCGALGHVLKLFNQESLAAVFLWGAGSFAQDDWSVAAALVPRLAILTLVAAFLMRPLRLLGLADESARGLGVSLTLYRTAALGVAVCMAASVTAAVGMIGFVEIAAPLAARLAGARRLGPRLAIAAVIGAAILLIVDALVQALNEWFGASLPTGAATTFLGAPLLLGLLPRMRAGVAGETSGWAEAGRRLQRPGRLLMRLTLLTLVALVLATMIGRTGLGWSIIGPYSWSALAPWRGPRTLEAFAGGAMLGTAGTLLQRATGNPMAGPEILGLGAAVMVGLAGALLIDPAASQVTLFTAGATGALILLIVLMGSGLRTRFAPDQLLLTGIALSAALDAVIFAFLALNDPRAGVLLGWMSGSTAGADARSTSIMVVLAAILVPIGLLFARSLDILPLGDPLARELGVSLTPTRFGIMLVSAALTAGAVLSVGPMTFVGLIGPHVTGRLGAHRSLLQVPGAALVGGLVMALADWLGRIVLAPFEIPAGLVAALIGIPYLVVQLLRRVPARSA
ncbi:Fe(3+)-hydroxamate ABC transporter permease FhuB [Lichenifustis flavocetrariae]|uniref:Fe(3+)-hydroxamate ABC transporter permease FhuB n=1 Tax=Lichenifustis flavocetrariae TaxID=2949735 RepID=A0AA41Z2A9_9HYPH|nr:Fe(3+)-hydroxamate ABC transporter permease FhuB [Lichenifustis flavocetrariae]MCW6509203.1 Fe(3+)-hydroxamate ABC transporter permease FhuB [Lichenifustis flavocetrariae]